MIKRIMSFATCVILIMSIIPDNKAYAESDYIGFYNGAIEMRFIDTSASTGTTYHTVGWMLHKNAEDGRDAYNKGKVGIMIGDEYQQTSEMPAGGGKVQTDFYIDATTVGYAQAAAAMGGITEGEIVYLDSIFEVLVNGVSTGKYYYTYDAIKNAKPWGPSTIEDLKNYYNKAIQFESATHNLYKEVKVNGVSISKEVIGSSKTGVVHNNITLEPTIEFGGSVATIDKSYFYYEVKKDEKLFELDSSNSSVCNRNPTMYAGGITVVADYKVDPKVRVEHFNLDTGTWFKENSKII